MKRLAICAALVSLLSACGSDTRITFNNASDRPLENVVLSGSGFEARLGVVAPGQSLTTKIHPSGESGLAVSFTANSQTFSYKPQGYFEGNGLYRVSTSVKRDLTVSVDSETWP